MIELFESDDGSYVDVPSKDCGCKNCGNATERTLESKFDGEFAYQRITCKGCGEKTCRKFRIASMDVRFGTPAPFEIEVPGRD